ncbi:ATP-binding cassette, subfamily C, exporter for protease/lipase/ATP-binding cassette, subfamily C, EexD [Desulfocicer vacuolatum DSM 3385]|uniref:ATP-binding cassette, subfamily C, exporter for protease/lipase/ATP-binding cassette, subfamily C, EexD n=1 Tax=Desulfocicer vacuolatum DSM 3385 TaxID=1121400 RepID=A0A1W2BUF2_9BACT|nr:type I secretion system permease/ATPase [Desulfocicer vacuolatum]SMC76364.1 ATP-binding cassette, subfamily C, exporter for protease/lipase/ATP-binding cassette, subfamily C, EexD [Desulfocicer vacuolatum DSM 3385]
MNKFFNEWKGYFTFAALLSCFINILQLTFPFYMFVIYGNVCISGSMASLETFTIAAIYALILLTFFSYVRSRLLEVASKGYNLKFRNKVYCCMLYSHANMNEHSSEQVLSDLGTIRKYFTTPAINALFDAPWAPLYLALIFLFHPVLGAIATAGAIIMVVLNVFQEFLVRDNMRAANVKNMENKRFIDAFLRNSEVINGMGMIGAIGDRWENNNRAVIVNQAVSSQYAGLIQSIIKPLQTFIQVVIYFAGACYALTQGFDVGLMVAASIVMGRALMPLVQVMTTWKMTLQARDAYGRLNHFLNHFDSDAPPMDLPVPLGTLHAKNVNFAIGDRLLLNDVSLHLNRGELLGIIGPNGAGKSTLCRVLLGLWPIISGKVTLDGADIYSRTQAQMGKYIGYLPQVVELFPATVAENIARLGPVDMEKVEKVATLCGIHTLIETFPKGYDTLLEHPDGVGLSGGQRQRLGLARALYGDPCLLVLDEPTSNLDCQGEAALLDLLGTIKLTRQCTCVMVTHKTELIQAMDKLLVLNGGRVFMSGAMEEVVTRLSRAHQAQSTPGGAASARFV